MNSFKSAVSAAAVLLALSLPAAAYTAAEVDQAMSDRIIALEEQIALLSSVPGSDTGRQNAEIRQLEARVKQLEAQQRNLDKKSEDQLNNLVGRFELDVSPA